MPIPAIRAQTDTGTPPPAPSPPRPEEWARTYVSIRGANGEGEEIPLTGLSSPSWPAIVIQPGASGLDLPPLELHADDSPNLDGSIFRSARRAAREIMLPLYLHGIDRRTLRDLKRRLARALDPSAGYCVLTFIEGDAQPRYLRCYYKGGMDGSEATDSAGFTWIRYGLQLTAYDPYFYSDAIQLGSWSFGATVPLLDRGRPLYPFRLSRAVLTTDVPIENPGDLPAWPIWQITGPVRSFKLVSPSGQSFGITPVEGNAVAASRVLTIDTRPGYKTLIDDAETNYWPLLDANPQLWPVPPDRSVLGLDVVSAGTSASVRLTILPRYTAY
jgi:hypothetical protein